MNKEHQTMSTTYNLAAAIAHYDKHAPAMENVTDFYDWLQRVLTEYAFPRSFRVADIGCGTGALLERLQHLGYSNVSGYDFSPGCLRIASERLPGVPFAEHNIEAGPLPQRYDLLLITGVLDFLADPIEALKNVRASLAPGGYALITIRNLHAYWPWYHLRGIAPLLKPIPRLHYWFLYFSTPLALRRNDQPIERMYTPQSVHSLLERVGLEVISTTGSQILPMLYIPGLPLSQQLSSILDSTVGRWAPHAMRYRYGLLCRASDNQR
jgi:SAM-dependent methyltransferase